MIISLRVSELEAKLFKAYAKSKNMSVSRLVRESVMSRIEKDYRLLKDEVEREVDKEKY